MKKGIGIDLADTSDAIESLAASFDKMTLVEMVDVAARLRGVRKASEALDKKIKDAIKDKLKHKAGSLNGEIFKAVLKIVPVMRLDQQRLKAEKPAIYDNYSRLDDDERVTFEPR